MNARLTRARLGWIVLVLAAFALLPSISLFADTSAVPRKLATVEGITEYALDNGLRILLFPDPSSATVTVNLTVLVGSRHEGYGETGMAHLLEHMVFKGTPSHPQIPKALRDHGADFNGTTWVDRTNYFETMPASDANLEFGIRLEADRLVNSYVRRDDLVSEMTVVRNEFEAGENNPERILSQRMLAAAYEWHNYGKSTIGNRSDIERVPIERLQAFYRKHYQPDNAILIIAGKFDPTKALNYISKYFGTLPRPNRVLENTYTEEPAQDGERVVTLRRVGSVGVVGVVYHIPAGSHEDYAPLVVLEDLLTSEPSGRLYQALVVAKKASSLSGTAYGWHDPGVLELTAQVDANKSLEEAQATLLQTLESLRQRPATEAEVERAKRRLLKNHELAMTRSGRVGISLSDWASQGDWRLLFLHRDRLSKVTPADVMRVAERYLQRNNRTVGLFVPTNQPQRAEIPPTPSVPSLVKDYQSTRTMAVGEAFDPTPANIEARLIQAELPSGVKSAFLPKKTRGGIVIADLTLHYGNEQSLKGQRRASEFLGPLMLRGTKHHTRQQLQDELDKLKARLNSGGGGGFSPLVGLGQLRFSIECQRENLPAVLKLLDEVLHEPSFPAEEFEVLRRQRLEGLRRGKTDPTRLAFQSLIRKLNSYPPDDVRYVPTIDEAIEQLEKLPVDAVRRLYQEQVGGQAGEFVAVGDIDAAATRTQVESMLKDWKTGVPYRHVVQVAQITTPGSREDILIPDKANAVFVAGHALALNDADPDFPALQLANFLLGEAPLSSRLSNRVRGKEGLSYGVGSQISADAKDKAGQFMIFAITNPTNIEKVDQTIAEELNKFLKEGVTPEEVKEGQKAFLQQIKVQLANDRMLAGMLEENLYVGRSFQYYADLEAKIAALTPEQINAAVKRYLDSRRLIIVRGGGFQEEVASGK